MAKTEFEKKSECKKIVTDTISLVRRSAVCACILGMIAFTVLFLKLRLLVSQDKHEQVIWLVVLGLTAL